MAQDKKTDKRELIIKAARDLIAENGFHASPASQIAQRAGIGVGTIYRYFENKDTLIYEVMNEVETRMKKNVFEYDDESLPVRERFVLIHTKLMNYLIGNPNDFKFLEQFHNSPYGVRRRQEKALAESENNKDKWHPLKKLFDYAKSRHMIKEIPNDMLCGFFFGPIVFLIKDHFKGFFELTNENIQVIVEACWDAIKI